MYNVIAQAGDLGQGTIDNIIIKPMVHRIIGALVLATFLVAVVWLVMLWIQKRPFDRIALVLLIIAQVVLVVQILAGIKLLDQGQGIFQLYVHYVAGIAPIVLFLAMSWIRFRSEVIKAKWLAIVGLISLALVAIAFTLGLMFVSQGLQALA